MTEPVAYRTKDVSETLGWRYSTLKPVNKRSEPLYTAEPLHLRVKMTQAEFDEFLYFYERYRVDTTTIAMLSYIRINKDGETETKNLYHRFYDVGTLNGTVEAQSEFSLLWVKFDPHNPEETIEIVPDMKWFVGRNDTSDDHRFLSKNVINLDNELNYAALKKAAKQFDTKEEAEKWTNPLTEAVQLPVEENLK